MEEARRQASLEALQNKAREVQDLLFNGTICVTLRTLVEFHAYSARDATKY